MLTPRFELRQEPNTIHVIIFAPYTKVLDVNITVQDNEFVFYAKPYLLRLHFPESLQEEGSLCEYIADDGAYSISIPKLIKGQYFPKLEFLNLILNKVEKTCKIPSVEILEDDTKSATKKVYLTNESLSVKCGFKTTCGYGFANKKFNVLYKEEFCHLVSIADPDLVDVKERAELREKCEEDKFDSDYYLADLYENKEIEKLLSFTPWWTSSEPVSFTQEDNVVLQKLPNRDYLLDKEEHQIVLCGLVDILFAYVYDVYTTNGEHNIESSWTIKTISPTFSWFDTSRSIQETIVACFRRSLCYPLYRNWNLSNKVKHDVAELFKRGTRHILHCLLRVWGIFNTADTSPCNILNDLYVTDYCVWLQKAPNGHENMTHVAQLLDDIALTKQDLNLDIHFIEQAAELVLQEDEEGDLNTDLDNLTI
ncbi:protein SHQ1 homolog [Clavelina lepadiformis]|uniref:protein SHQ1 homolog n=1 Tax=Clavelina lepadiformis TaxID=159417 RepID=UPI0040429D85